MSEKITIERLEAFSDMVKELKYLNEKKQAIEQRISLLKGVSYDRDKIQSGNGRKLSEQERFVLILENTNERIKNLEKKLIPEKKIIISKISKIKEWNYRRILVLRYIEKWKWSAIIEDFFYFNDDYEECKYDKYKDKVLFWHRSALRELKKV